MDEVTARLCSQNEHKRAELARILGGWRIELLDADEFPPEDGTTFLDNARAKAEFGRRVGPAGEWMLGEDSGLELAALGGRPGVETARWAGGRHVERALEALAGESDRAARYVCELVALSPEGIETRGTGTLRRADRARAARRRRLRLRPRVRPRRRGANGRGARRRVEGGALPPRPGGAGAAGGVRPAQVGPRPTGRGAAQTTS